MSAAPAFTRHVGIDYSGAQTPNASLKGLRIYMAEDGEPPQEVLPPPSPRRYWSRRGVAEWLIARLQEDVPTLVGIDHGFSFPLDYFDAHQLPRDWDAFLDDFQEHWPTDQDISVNFVRERVLGNGAARQGNTRWRRLTEQRAGSAKSVFHFDVQGSVAKSTHSGIPWLRSIRRHFGERIHFWPFDGWDIPEGRSAVAEVYPALWSRGFENEGRTPDQHDAFSIAAWMAAADRDGRLVEALKPQLADEEKAIAMAEGWILGVPTVAERARPQRAEDRLDPEKVAYWYFRLNGFLQMENFVVHPPWLGGQRTDADLIGIRFPYRAERLIDDPNNVMEDHVGTLALSPDLIDVAIVEVKGGRQPCTLNGPWTKQGDRNIDRLLAAIGCLAVDQIPAASADLYELGKHVAGGIRIRFIAVGTVASDDLAVRYPAVTQVTWPDALGFVWRRFQTFFRQKRDVGQWDEQGRRLKHLADHSWSAVEFIEEAMKRMGVRR